MASEPLMVLPYSALLSVEDKRAIAKHREGAAAAEGQNKPPSGAHEAIRLPTWFPYCERCARPVDRVEFSCDPVGLRVAVTVLCHGAMGKPRSWGTLRREVA